MQTSNTLIVANASDVQRAVKTFGDNTKGDSNQMLSLKPEAWKPKHGYSLADFDFDNSPVEYIAGMFPKGKVSALIGEAGTGKSWVLTASGLTITDGKRFLPKDNYVSRSDGKVLIVDTEGRIKTYWQRIQELGGTLDNFMAPCEKTHILEFKPDDKQRVEKVIEIDKPDFVIFDSFAGLSDVDENSSRVNECVKWFSGLALRYEVAVTYSHLVSKGDTKNGRLTKQSARGFSGLNQFVEIMWAIDTPDTRGEQFKRLYQVKNNFEQQDTTDYVFKLEDSTITFVEGGVQVKDEKIARRMEILEANRDKEPAEIARLIHQHEPEAKLNSLTQWVIRNL
jgi:RecA-family ATPase